MKLHDFLRRTCVIIPLLNGITVCGTRGPRARCAGYFQHMVLYTIVKYSIQYSLKNLWTEGILYDLQKNYGNGALKYATVLMMVGSQLKMTLGWVGRFPFWRKRTITTVKTLIEEDAHYTMQEIEELRSVRVGCLICSLTSRNKVGLDLHRKL